MRLPVLLAAALLISGGLAHADAGEATKTKHHKHAKHAKHHVGKAAAKASTADPKEIARFDVNHDGALDADEKAAMRKAARQHEVEAGGFEHARKGKHHD